MSITDSADRALPAPWQAGVKTDDSGIIKKGSLLIFGFTGLFLVWSLLFPLTSAIIANGQLVSGGQNKLLQHRTGGVVREIKAVDGQVLKKGDVILVLDPAVNQAEFTRLVARHNVLSALKARLEAQKTGAPTPDFAELVPVSQVALRGGQGVSSSFPQTNARTARIVEEQKSEFDHGRKRLAAQTAALEKKAESLRARREGLAGSLSSQDALLRYTNMEIGKITPLVRSGYVAKIKLWDLEKRRLEQISTIDKLVAEIDSLDQQIQESEAEIRRHFAGESEKTSRELTDVIGELAEIGDQLRAAEIALNLAKIRAPVSGTLTKLSAHTVGGVVAAGSVVGEIVPDNNDLVAEVRIAPKDIYHVTQGQKAKVVVTAFNRRLFDPAEAEVAYVSADSTTDPTSGEKYFVARVRLSGDNYQRTGMRLMKAGMQTEVYIRSEPRVFMSFLLQPIGDSLFRAFREPK